VPTDLPSIIGQGVAASVNSAVAAIDIGDLPDLDIEDVEAVSASGASVKTVNGVTTARSPSGAIATIYPPDAQGRRRIVARSPNGATVDSFVDADDDIPGLGRQHGARHDRATDQAIAMKAIGVTPEYLAAVRAASPALRNADMDDIIGMKAVGVTPDYIRDLAAAGFGNLEADDLTGARAVGVTGDFIRRMRAAGYNGDIDDFVELRVTSGFPFRAGSPPRPPKPPRSD
jgi:bla regulator protein blaR1